MREEKKILLAKSMIVVTGESLALFGGGRRSESWIQGVRGITFVTFAAYAGCSVESRWMWVTLYTDSGDMFPSNAYALLLRRELQLLFGL